MKEEETMTTKNIKNILAVCFVSCCMTAPFVSCSDEHMQAVNTDNTKTLTTDPNGQLTTALLQTYGDFGLMDTYRSYITGFTQHFAGGWNVSKYAGSVHYEDDQARLIWDRYYTVAIKNLRDAIDHSSDKLNLNAVLRIHRVYLMSVLTDVYGDVPCLSIAEGLGKDLATPAYDKQEDIYKWIFTELKACVAQLGTGSDAISGDVTNYIGDVDMWKKYANSLRMRYAMRISDVAKGDPDKPEALNARSEFEAAYHDPAGYIMSSKEDAFIKYENRPFTLYAGSNEYDYRVNALGEMLYGQDSQSPSFVSSTLWEYLNENNDPRRYKIVRHYLNIKRSEIKPDKIGNKDLTDEVIRYLTENGKEESPCDPGYAWYGSPWLSAPAHSETVLPTLHKLATQFPEVGYDKNNYPERMMRPALSLDFEMPDRPGILMTYPEVELLLAEAKSKDWDVDGSVVDHYKNGTREALLHINKYYLESDDVIADADIDTYVNNMVAKSTLTTEEGAREAINLQAWILHMMNPAEAWANLRRADYPKMKDRNTLGKNSDFTYDSDDLSTPNRLCYPTLESKYNTTNFETAIGPMGGKDDWHHRVWWDAYEINVKYDEHK